MIDPVVLKVALSPKLGKIAVKGSDLLFSCPFHKDKTPSARLSYTKEVFHCFSCDAVYWLPVFLQMMGVNPLRLYTVDDSPTSRKQLPEYEDIYDNTDYSREYGLSLYNDAMPVSYSKKALDYLHSRVGDDLGCIPFRFKYHVERNSIIFLAQTIVERFLDPEAVPKAKSHGRVNIVYNPADGFPVKKLILVEGLVDYFCARRAGHLNVACNLNTAITARKMRQLDEICKGFLLTCFDADLAGMAGANKIDKKLLKTSLVIKRLNIGITDNKDFGDCTDEEIDEVIGTTEHSKFDLVRGKMEEFDKQMFG